MDPIKSARRGDGLSDDARENMQLEKLRAIRPMGGVSESPQMRRPLIADKLDAKGYGKEIEEEINDRVRAGDRASGEHCDELVNIAEEVAQQDRTHSIFVLSQGKTPLEIYVVVHLKAKTLKRLLSKVAMLADVCKSRGITPTSNVDVYHDDKPHYRLEAEILCAPEHLERRRNVISSIPARGLSPKSSNKLPSLVSVDSAGLKRSKTSSRELQEKLLQDGSIYRGELSDGKPHGFGTVQYSENDAKQRVRFAGEFEHGIRKGSGCLTWKDGAQYAGDWYGDKPCGFGVENYPDGSSYVGQYEDDMRHGFGTYTFPSGAKYEGCWLSGKRHGKGVENSKKGTFVSVFEDNKRVSQEEYIPGRDPQMDRQLAQIRAAVDKGRACGDASIAVFEQSFKTRLQR
mmetsp:Transcript_9619/g.27648  ORF Transcript_9619/g.27648 Transcript_9619/m.27648 type:complete len:401 (-) Transcript_9619:723-1925(-)